MISLFLYLAPEVVMMIDRLNMICWEWFLYLAPEIVIMIDGTNIICWERFLCMTLTVHHSSCYDVQLMYSTSPLHGVLCLLTCVAYNLLKMFFCCMKLMKLTCFSPVQAQTQLRSRL